MTTFNRLLSQILTALRQHLSAYGFTRKGNNFIKWTPDAYWLINVQRSVGNTAENGKFTLNIGVSHSAINPDLAIRIEYCEYQNRIGQFHSYQPDKWWHLEPNTTLEPIISEIVTSLSDNVLPTLDRAFLSERELLKELAHDFTLVGRLDYHPFVNLLVKHHMYQRAIELLEHISQFFKDESVKWWPDIDASKEAYMKHIQDHITKLIEGVRQKERSNQEDAPDPNTAR